MAASALVLLACGAPVLADSSVDVSFLRSATPAKFTNVSQPSLGSGPKCTSHVLQLAPWKTSCQRPYPLQATNQKNLTTWAVKTSFTEQFKSVQSCLPLSLTFATANNASVTNYQFSVNTTDLECVLLHMTFPLYSATRSP